MTDTFRHERAKRVFDRLLKLAVAPLRISYEMRCRMVGSERAYLELSERAAGWPGIRGERMRAALHRQLGTEVGEAAILRFGCVLKRPPLSIGRMTVLSHYSHVQCASIGADCLIGDNVLVFDGRHQHHVSRIDIPINAQGGSMRQVRIGDDVFIGAHSTVLADIGNHCIVAAGSVVIDPVPDYKVVAGNPARVVGDRREEAGR